MASDAKNREGCLLKETAEAAEPDSGTSLESISEFKGILPMASFKDDGSLCLVGLACQHTPELFDIYNKLVTTWLPLYENLTLKMLHLTQQPKRLVKEQDTQKELLNSPGKPPSSEAPTTTEHRPETDAKEVLSQLRGLVDDFGKAIIELDCMDLARLHTLPKESARQVRKELIQTIDKLSSSCDAVLEAGVLQKLAEQEILAKEQSRKESHCSHNDRQNPETDSTVEGRDFVSEARKAAEVIKAKEAAAIKARMIVQQMTAAKLERASRDGNLNIEQPRTAGRGRGRGLNNGIGSGFHSAELTRRNPNSALEQGSFVSGTGTRANDPAAGPEKLSTSSATASTVHETVRSSEAATVPGEAETSVANHANPDNANEGETKHKRIHGEFYYSSDDEGGKRRKRGRRKQGPPIDWGARVIEKIKGFKERTSIGGCVTQLYNQPAGRETLVNMLDKCEEYLDNEAAPAPQQLRMAVEVYVASLECAYTHLAQLRINKTQLYSLHKSALALDVMQAPSDLLPEIFSYCGHVNHITGGKSKNDEGQQSSILQKDVMAPLPRHLLSGIDRKASSFFKALLNDDINVQLPT